VFGFAKQSGGDIDVTSHLGHGTTFSLYLPEIPVTAAPAPTSDEVPAPRDEDEALHVLVVEDNSAVGRSAAEALADLGFTATWAVDAREALDRLSSGATEFDVVFSDVVMPGMTGLEMALIIRQRHPGLPIILTSGYSHVLADEGRHGFELLQKPYSVDQLSRVLRAVTRRKGAPVPA
jgi:CheY-like chemotaxis protein